MNKQDTIELLKKFTFKPNYLIEVLDEEDSIGLKAYRFEVDPKSKEAREEVINCIKAHMQADLPFPMWMEHPAIASEHYEKVPFTEGRDQLTWKTVMTLFLMNIHRREFREFFLFDGVPADKQIENESVNPNDHI